ncbi:MAG: cell division protein ZipA, partial [Luminiphilus sp.]
ELPSFSATEEGPVPAVEAAPAARGQDQGHGEVATPTPAGRDDTPETMDWLDSLEAPEPEPEPEVRLPRDIDPHVFVLNVEARSEHGFSGSDILAVLLACDLRFGDMDFFHRHEQSAGRGPIQFTVCNMMKPGVFDIDAMDHLRTRGLMFFVTLPGPDDMLKAFDYMYETAKVVARNLDGDVLDETRSAITRQSLEHMRQQIRELERRIAMQQRL